MFLRLLAFPFILAIIVLLYLAWEVDSNYAFYILPPILILAVGYIFSPQIEWWRAQTHPPQLDSSIRFLLEQHSPFYQSLSESEQEKFRHRVTLYIMAKEFHGQAMENVPEDIKGVIAINAVHLTFYQEDFLFNTFENIIVYPHPFPSPQYLEHWHASEIYEADGAILFSTEHLMTSYLQPQKFYNIGLYEFTKVFLLSHPNLNYPKVDKNIWITIEAISGWSEEYISAWVGLPNIEILPACIVTYLTFPISFQQQAPILFKELSQILKEK